jgi:hypothetical protein
LHGVRAWRHRGTFGVEWLAHRKVQQAQDDLKGLVTAQQSEINIGTSVLHESMLAMDTKDQQIHSRKALSSA